MFVCCCCHCCFVSGARAGLIYKCLGVDHKFPLSLVSLFFPPVGIALTDKVLSTLTSSFASELHIKERMRFQIVGFRPG